MREALLTYAPLRIEHPSTVPDALHQTAAKFEREAIPSGQGA
jgi:hypothetical protein